MDETTPVTETPQQQTASIFAPDRPIRRKGGDTEEAPRRFTEEQKQEIRDIIREELTGDHNKNATVKALEAWYETLPKEDQEQFARRVLQVVGPTL
jgi:hypothetical protein